MATEWRMDRKDLELLVDELEIHDNNQKVKDHGGKKAIARMLVTDLDKGLPENEKKDGYAARKAEFGDNRIPRPPKNSFLSIFWASFQDAMLIILVVMAFISIVLEVGVPLVKYLQNPHREVEVGEFPWYLGWIEGAAILAAVFIVSIVTTVNDWQKEKRFRELLEQGDRINVRAVRGGNDENVCIDDLYPGDIVHLSPGDKVPADGILIRGYDIKINQASVTGETDSIDKDKDHPLLMSGTEVSEGEGVMLVLAVGCYSIWGKTMLDVTGGGRKKKLSENEEDGEEETGEGIDDETPLEKKLGVLAKKISVAAFAVAGIALIILIAGMIFRKFQPNTWTLRFTKDDLCSNESWLDQATPEQMAAVNNCGAIGEDLTKLVTFIIFAVTIVVAAVPEGLPLAVTISLAYSVRQMLNDKNLVRKLKSCETMGGAHTICSDKTGTLTRNEMMVVKTWIGGRKYFGKSSGRTNFPHEKRLKGILLELISEGICCNTTANLLPKTKDELNPNEPEDSQFHTQGNKTESALLLFLQLDLHTPYKEIRRFYEKNKLVKKKYPFSSNMKRMSVVVERKDGTNRLFVKGAAEIVLGLCEYYINGSGNVVKMSEKKKKELSEMISFLAKQGLRTLCLAYRDLEMDEAVKDSQTWNQKDIEKNLICYLIVGIKDPLRKEVKKAVRNCKSAGIIVRMVTGDNIDTARHIAAECGIFDEELGHICVNGFDFRNMSDREVVKIIPELRVMARSKPEDKRRLVKILMELKQTVAVTGDGTNDAPALKAADVGLAMGLSGTEVAKAASDIVILDDNFASIVKAVLWGRTIYDNIRKFLQFQLTVNVVACTLSVICSLTQFFTIRDSFGQPIETNVPFTAVQLLWVNLIMDTLAALSLATEPPVPAVLERKPYSKTENFVNWKMWVSILTQASYQLLILIFIHYVGIFIPFFQTLSYGFYQTIEFTSFPDYKWLDENHVYRPWVKNTMVFNTFVFLQVFNEINCRRINCEWNIFGNIHRSFMFVSIFIGVVVLQVVIVQVGMWEPGHLFFSTTGLDWYQWIICIGLGASCILVHFVKNALMILFEKYFLDSFFNFFSSKKAKEDGDKNASIQESEESTEIELDDSTTKSSENIYDSQISDETTETTDNSLESIQSSEN